MFIIYIREAFGKLHITNDLFVNINTFSFAVNQTLSISISDINDQYPLFVEKSYTVDIPEEMPVGMAVTVVTAEDKDIGKNAELTYTIIAGSHDHFYMDSIFVTGTGVIRIKKVPLWCSHFCGHIL